MITNLEVGSLNSLSRPSLHDPGSLEATLYHTNRQKDMYDGNTIISGGGTYRTLPPSKALLFIAGGFSKPPDLELTHDSQ